MSDQGTTPAVSVIVPTYNRGHLIGKALKSVLDQSYRDIEVIVVDDASVDDTADVVRSFDDVRVKYIRLDANRGASAARNVGIASARGDLIAFQDSDNEWMEQKLEKQLSLFAEAPSDIGLVYSGALRRCGGEETYIPDERIHPKEGDVHKELLMGNFIDLSAALVKKECFDTAGTFDEALPRLQDWELWIRFSKHYHFRFLDEPLVILNIGSDSISSQHDKLPPALEYIIDKHYEEFLGDKRALVRQQILASHFLCLFDDPRKGREYMLKARGLNPLSPRCLVLFFASFLGQDIYRKLQKGVGRIKGDLRLS